MNGSRVLSLAFLITVPAGLCAADEQAEPTTRMAPSSGFLTGRALPLGVFVGAGVTWHCVRALFVTKGSSMPPERAPFFNTVRERLQRDQGSWFAMLSRFAFRESRDVPEMCTEINPGFLSDDSMVLQERQSSDGLAEGEVVYLSDGTPMPPMPGDRELGL